MERTKDMSNPRKSSTSSATAAVHSISTLVSSDIPHSHSHSQHQPPQQNQTLVPPGVLSIYQACNSIYKNQPNPLQVTSIRKYWLDGPDPLDYISMYVNDGDQNRGIPKHWHYVSHGLSDLHGDGRVHERAGPGEPSGYGFELTFRLRREEGTSSPPTWPTMLMQDLARYVFQSDNTLQSGDHVSWHTSLDRSDSRIQHMLMAEDAQLSPIKTPLGQVHFIQIVGVCSEELKAAQHWNGPGVLELLRSNASSGGPWLITDMRRGETIFELDLNLQERLEQGIEQEGSNLSGVSGLVHWEEVIPDSPSSDKAGDDDSNVDRMSADDTAKIRNLLQKGLRTSHHQPANQHADTMSPAAASHVLPGSRKDSIDSNYSGDHPIELVRSKTLKSVHIQLNAETGSLLPLALRGRLKHGRHFTFKSTLDDSAVTLVSPSVEGALVDHEHKFATHSLWLQVLLDDDFIDQLCNQLDILGEMSQIKLPKLFHWREHNLTISILPDMSFRQS